MCGRILILLIIVISLFKGPSAEACTLWAATGDAVVCGGSLLAKNRDWQPNHSQELKIVSPPNGYKYLALVVPAGFSDISPGIRGGINEKGLAVVNATAGSIPSSERQKMESTSGLIGKLLSQCGSVEEALAKTDLFVGPRFLMLADKHKTAVVEIGPEGRIAISRQENGILYHTNHYLDPSLLDANKKVGISSAVRLKRIGELLTQGRAPYSLDTFIDISQDQNSGPDNSIFRTGSKPTGTRTLAVLIFHIPPHGSPEAYIRIMNPEQEEQVYRLNLGDVFKNS